jgi:hypothetical protein
MTRDLRSIIRKADDDNEHFLGEVLDEEKKARLDRIRALCREISDEEPEIRANFLPFSNRSRNGTASLIFPSMLFCANANVNAKLSEIFSMTDAFVTTTLQGTLKLSFIVHDMWSKFGYDNDMEHGK